MCNRDQELCSLLFNSVLFSLLSTSEKFMYLFWNLILFHLLLDDRVEAYVPGIFPGSKVKSHYCYYLLKLNCRNSMIPSAHVFFNVR